MQPPGGRFFDYSGAPVGYDHFATFSAIRAYPGGALFRSFLSRPELLLLIQDDPCFEDESDAAEVFGASSMASRNIAYETYT